jgi:hypothetical protein
MIGLGSVLLLLLLLLSLAQSQDPSLVFSIPSVFSIQHPMASSAGGLADYNDLAWFCGGRNSTDVSDQCLTFSPRDCLLDKPSCARSYRLSERRWGAGSARMKNQLWLFGGFRVRDWTLPGSATDLIETVTRQGVRTEPDRLSVPRGFILTVVLPQVRAYAIGGLSDCCEHGNVDVLRGNGDVWTPNVTTLKTPRGDACGAFLDGPGGGSQAIVIGGRTRAGNSISSIETIYPNGTLGVDRRLEGGRFGCVAATSPDRKSIAVMGGIRTIDTRLRTQMTLGSIEIITAFQVLTMSVEMTAASHMTLVEAPPLWFIIGGSDLTGTAGDSVPPNRQSPISTVDVVRMQSDGIPLFEKQFFLYSNRANLAAAVTSNDTYAYVVVAGGNFDDSNDTVPTEDSIEVIEFSTATATSLTTTVANTNMSMTLRLTQSNSAPSTSSTNSSTSTRTTTATTDSDMTAIVQMDSPESQVGLIVGIALAAAALVAVAIGIAVFLFVRTKRPREIVQNGVEADNRRPAPANNEPHARAEGSELQEDVNHDSNYDSPSALLQEYGVMPSPDKVRANPGTEYEAL